MVEYSGYIAKKWDISEAKAREICEHFVKGDTIFYIHDYVPSIAAEVEITTLADMYDTLVEIKNLDSKKKRVLNALKKANAYTEAGKKRVMLCTSSVELDDMLLPYRPNPRSRGQQALKKGLGPLADCIDAQEVEEGSIEELAKEYVGTESSLQTVDDVIAGVKEILIERYAYDETVRSMVREVGFEDGFFEVLPKVKRDKRFIAYRGKMVPISDLTSEEYLTLTQAEEEKQIRFKHGVQLFHINELLRQHFIENPDAIGYDLICEVIDECWSRSLQPVVERDVKARVYREAEDWAIRKIDEELQGALPKKQPAGTVIVIGKYLEKSLTVVAVNKDGHLLGAAHDKLSARERDFFSNRITQFYNRYKPKKVIIHDNASAEATEEVVKKALRNVLEDLVIERYVPEENTNDLKESPWMQERCAVLEEDMKDAYACGLSCLQPINLIPQIGIHYFSIHPLQKFIRAERLERLLRLRNTVTELHNGIPYLDAPDSVLQNFDCVPKEVLVRIRREGAKAPFATKNDLLHIEGMTELIFRNIAGYIIILNTPSSIDRTLVHPDFYEWINEISLELNASLDSLVNDPERLRSIAGETFEEKMYLDQKLPEHLRVGQKYPVLIQGSRQRRKQRLSDLKEGTVVSGRVTNITKFGVFVDINAVCDGLIHISQLADEYVETADQVVKPNDRVDVRILKVDKKKRRVSLSMKKMGVKAPKIRPSQGQLSNLADHFKNR